MHDPVVDINVSSEMKWKLLPCTEQRRQSYVGQWVHKHQFSLLHLCVSGLLRPLIYMETGAVKQLIKNHMKGWQQMRKHHGQQAHSSGESKAGLRELGVR